MPMLESLENFGYEKLRRAASLLGLSFFASLYVFMGLSLPAEMGWGPAFLGLGLCYVVAFVAVAAEWFWGRWFASGLGWFGVIVGAYSLMMVGALPFLVAYLILHGVVVIGLMGAKMAALYEQQEAWRQRYGMDEFGVDKLRKTVTRAASALPALVLWALGPKGESDALVATLAAGAGAVGLVAVLRGRTWGLFGLAAAAAGLAWFAAPTVKPAAWLTGASASVAPAAFVSAMGCFVAAALLAFAVLPFARPALNYLRADRA